MAEGDVELGHVDIESDEEAQNPSDQQPGWILMVPKVYRDLSPHSFTPRVVSIGPLHHEDEHLKGFEVHKATYMHNLLHNLSTPLNSTPEQIIKECEMKIGGSLDKIKACYIGMKAYPDSELVKMMVTDACFILAYLYDPHIGYSSLGPIKLLSVHIYLDMVLIENQIPFFVLQDIFECTISKLRDTLPLAKYILRIQDWCIIFEGDLVMDNSSISTTHVHILGFLHKFYQNPDRDPSTCDNRIKGPSAVELDRSGVRFSNKLDTKWPLAMKLEFSRFLWSKPTLKMPTLVIHDNLELILRNFIIYEQFFDVPTCVTSYMCAVDFLIDTPEDVARLVRSKAFSNVLGSNEEAVGIINNTAKQVLIRDFYYKDEWEKMAEYYNAKWPKFIAQLKRKYFSNPWSIIALLAGIILFVLTVVQTVYSVK